MKIILSDPSKIKIALYSHYKMSLMQKFFLRYFGDIISKNKTNGNKPIRCGIQILCFSLIFDIIWIIKYTGFWRHGEETSALWQSLSSAHNLAYFLSFIEFLLKLPLVMIFFNTFKRDGGRNAELFSLRY